MATRLQSRYWGPMLIAVGALSVGDVSAQPRTELEEVVVTARRVAESLQQSPVSVTALGESYIQRTGIANVTDIERATPNLTFTTGTGGGSSTVNAFIRGAGEFDFIITTDPAVGTYIDGVYLARAFGANLELGDVARIEVLRGPQGTLFGKNSIGGAINVVTRRPADQFEGNAEVSIGRFDYRGAKLYVTGPLTDTLAASVSLLSRHADGWQKRPGHDAGDIDVMSGRAMLRWSPNDIFESLLSVDGINQDQAGYPNVMEQYSPTPTTAFPLGIFSPDCCFPNNDIDRSNAGGELPNDQLEGYGITWTNDLKLDPVTIKSITAFRTMNALFGRDGDNSQASLNGDIHDEDHQQYSQELQFSGNSFNDRLEWLAGLYYFKEDSRDDTRLILLPGFGLSPNYYNIQETENHAVYLHANWHLSQRWTLIAGVRWTDEEKTFRQTITNLDFGGPWVFPPIPTPGIGPGLPTSEPTCSDIAATQTRFKCQEDWQELSPKLGAEFQASDDLMLYGHWSQGFRSGGFNGRPFASTGDIRTYDPETLDSYEVGFKSEWLNRKLRLNGSFYYNQYKDIQVLIIRSGSVAIENASEAVIQGFELEAYAVPVAGLEINTGVGYIADDSDGWVDATGDFTDTELQQTPEWSFNAAASYEWDWGSVGAMRVDADVKYKDDYYLDAVNTESLRQGGYTLYNAGLTYLSPQRDWEVALRGENLTDKRVRLSGFDGVGFFGYTEAFYNPPRRWYLTARYRF